MRNPLRFIIPKLKNQTEKSPEQYNKSVVPPRDTDGSLDIYTYNDVNSGGGGGAFQTAFVDMYGSFRTDADLVSRYRSMAQQAEPDQAIEDIVNDAVVTNSAAQPVSLNLEDVELSESIKKKIITEFDVVLRLLNFEREGQDIFRRWYVDGRLYYHAIVDEKKPSDGITELRYIDALKIKKIKEIKKERDKMTGGETVVSTKEYYVFTERETTAQNLGAASAGGDTLIKIAPEAICYCNSGVIDLSRKTIISYLHKAIRPLNQLRMVENSVVIYRVSRAPERRIFYVDVGNMPPAKIEQYLTSVMNKYRNRLTYNTETGDLQDDKKHMHMLEDFWIPRKENGRGTEITTLPGGDQLGEMTDVEYFLKKMYRALNVPISRLEAGGGFNIGRSSEITRDEVKFSKFIFKLRTRFAILFDEILKRHLVLKKIITDDDWEDLLKHNIRYVYARDSFFEELKEAEVLRERISTLGEMEQYIGKYFTEEYVYRNVLRFTDKEVEQMKSQHIEEAKDNQEQEKKLEPFKSEDQKREESNDSAVAHGDSDSEKKDDNASSGNEITLNVKAAEEGSTTTKAGSKPLSISSKNSEDAAKDKAKKASERKKKDNESLPSKR